MATHAHPVGGHRVHFDPWHIAVVVLAAIAVGLGAWVVVDRTSSSPTPGVATPDVTSMLNARLAALNSGNAKAISGFYTADAVLEEHDVTPTNVTRGNQAIGDAIATYVNFGGMHLKRVSPIIQTGRSVSEAVIAPSEPGWGLTLVYLLDQNSGKIAHQWVLPAQDAVPAG